VVRGPWLRFRVDPFSSSGVLERSIESLTLFLHPFYFHLLRFPFPDDQSQAPVLATHSKMLREGGRCEIAVLAPAEVGAQEATPDPLGHRGDSNDGPC
jgi:hypothetical protein